MLTGSQLPLALPRSDARQNLLDSVCCATAGFSPPHIHLQGAVGWCSCSRVREAGKGLRMHVDYSSVYTSHLSLVVLPPPRAAATEVGLCFGGRLMRGNRAQKVNSNAYQVRLLFLLDCWGRHACLLGPGCECGTPAWLGYHGAGGHTSPPCPHRTCPTGGLPSSPGL